MGNLGPRMFGFFDVVTAGYLIEFTSRPPEGKRKENHTNTREPGPRSGPGDRNAGIVGQGLGTEDDGNGGTSLPLVIFNPPPQPPKQVLEANSELEVIKQSVYQTERL